MINAYINSRLVIWSEWELKREEGALGYPTECPYTRLVQRSGGAGFKPDFDSDAYEISLILIKIKNINPEIYRVLHLFYGVEFSNGQVKAVSMTRDAIAKDIKCHRDTVYNYIDKGHKLIMDFLHENDVIAHLRKK